MPKLSLPTELRLRLDGMPETFVAVEAKDSRETQFGESVTADDVDKELDRVFILGRPLTMMAAGFSALLHTWLLLAEGELPGRGVLPADISSVAGRDCGTEGAPDGLVGLCEVSRGE